MLLSYQKPLCGKKIGVVFGSFAPLHQGHLDMIMKAKKENDGGCIVIVCGYDGDKGEPLIPHKTRYNRVRKFFADDDFVAVYAINDTELGIAKYPNGWEGWLKEFNRIYSFAVNKPENAERIWYVGEPDYEEGLRVRGEDAVLLDRTINPISATMIRNNPILYWDKIAYTFREFFSKNILITGTASEGKTTLVEDVGKYFNAPYSYEWAREYMEECCISDWEISAADFIAFLNGQHQLNQSLIRSKHNRGVFIADTDSLVTKMYAESYAKEGGFNISNEEYKAIAKTADLLTNESKWDKIFLLCPKGVFVDDHTRYRGHSDIEERIKLFNNLCQHLKENNLWDKVEILSGNYNENFDAVKRYIEGVLDYE